MQVNAYIQCNKLRSAYLLAVQMKNADLIRTIAQLAEKAGQTNVKVICEKWLQQNKKWYFINWFKVIQFFMCYCLATYGITCISLSYKVIYFFIQFFYSVHRPYFEKILDADIASDYFNYNMIKILYWQDPIG